VADLEADIPQRGNKGGERVVTALWQVVGQQQHDIHIRRGMQFAAAIATDGDQCGAQWFDVLLPQSRENVIYQVGACVHQLYDGFARQEARAQGLAGGR